MAFTQDFNNIFRRKKRNFEDIDTAFKEAVIEANQLDIQAFRERKKRNSGFKRQKSAMFDFDF